MKVPWPPNGPPPKLRHGDKKRVNLGAIIWRIYFAGGAHPVNWDAFRHFGPTTSRFDHHTKVHGKAATQKRGIYYAAGDPVTALAETFQGTRTIDRSTNRPWLVGLELTRNIELLNLGGAFITRAGASPAINSCSKAKSRAWSGYLYHHYGLADGLCYPSSMWGPGLAFALYERAQSAIPLSPVFNRALSDPALYPRLLGAASRLGFTLF